MFLHIMWEHIMIYDRIMGKGVDIDIIDRKVIIDKITAVDFEPN